MRSVGHHSSYIALSQGSRSERRMRPSIRVSYPTKARPLSLSSTLMCLLSIMVMLFIILPPKSLSRHHTRPQRFSLSDSFSFSETSRVFARATAGSDFAVASNPIPLSNKIGIRFVTFGALRTSFGGLDDPQHLAGYLATIRKLNAENRSAMVIFDENGDPIPVRVKFRLNVTTIPCYTYEQCTADEAQQYVTSFIQSLPQYAAVLRPNIYFAGLIIDAARAAGNIPVVAPETMRSIDFLRSATNVINFNQEWRGQFDHLFTYMMQSGQCVFTGILHRNHSTESAENTNTAYIQRLFTNGLMPAPPSLNIDICTDDSLEQFVVKEDSRRRCFIVAADFFSFSTMIERLSKMPSYMSNPRRFSFYGVSHMVSDAFLLGGSSRPFGKVHFLHWSPPSITELFAPVYEEWLASPTAEELEEFRYEAFPTRMSPNAARGHIILNGVAEAVREALRAAGDFPWPADDGARFPANHSTIIDFFYRNSMTLEGYPFQRLSRECPPEPFAQICFCNTATTASYVYRLNLTDPTGGTFARFDQPLEGERDMSSIDFPNTCRYEASSWSYPITTVALFPESLIGSDENSRLDAILDSAADTLQIFRVVYSYAVFEQNFASVRPPRPLRYSSIVVPTGSTTQSVIDSETELYDPFVIYGSMEAVIEGNPHGILTLLPNMMGLELEDPPLVPHEQWKWYNLWLQPTLADYIHSLVSYYKDNAAKFTAVHAIASTPREAELISMSFATFGYLIKVESIVVSEDPQEWADLVSLWASTAQAESPGIEPPPVATANGSDHAPFILAASQNNTNEVMLKAAVAFYPHQKGTLACATSVVTAYRTAVSVGDLAEAMLPTTTAETATAPIVSDTSDVIFGAFRREWWSDDIVSSYADLLKNLVPNPRFHIAKLAVELVTALSSNVWYDYKTTAAEILYKQSVVTAAETVFGPFSNATCTPEEIGANTRDRQCQCTKGVRTVFIHSMKDMYERTNSDRTGRYAYTMTTCGVVYLPYVPPPALALADSALLSDGVVAGIAVGASAFVLVFVAALVFSLCCLGRNNRAAPTDPSQPFAIVFTDIQSSTALWARAPSAMSEAVEEHHRIMRKALRQSSGYEVKTVGDSFMVAFKNVDDAVQFSLDAQRYLYEAEWSDEIDAIYVELLLEAQLASHHNEGGDQQKGKRGDEAATISATSRLNAVETFSFTNESQRHPNLAVRSTHSGHPITVDVETSYVASDFGSKAGSPALLANGDTVNFSRSERNSPATLQASQSPRKWIKNSTAIASQAQVNSDAIPGVLSTELPAPPTIAPFTEKSNNVVLEQLVLPEGAMNAATSRTNEDEDAPPNKHQEKDAMGVTLDGLTNRHLWHGVRVRIGVHYGMGDIRKDPVSLGYDYYGTVVNTAARVEGVGHGGQILVTEDAFSALSDAFRSKLRMADGGCAEEERDRKKNAAKSGAQSVPQESAHNASTPKINKWGSAVVLCLGSQPLRGLDEPITLFQIVPTNFLRRRFPELRIHIEKETVEDELSTKDTATGTNSKNLPNGESATTASGEAMTTEELIARLCFSKQYTNLSPEFVLTAFTVLSSALSPTPRRYQTSVLSKLGEAWGFEKAAKRMADATPLVRPKLIVALTAKVCKALVSSRKLKGISISFTDVAALGSNDGGVAASTAMATSSSIQGTSVAGVFTDGSQHTPLNNKKHFFKKATPKSQFATSSSGAVGSVCKFDKARVAEQLPGGVELFPSASSAALDEVFANSVVGREANQQAINSSAIDDTDMPDSPPPTARPAGGYVTADVDPLDFSTERPPAATEPN